MPGNLINVNGAILAGGLGTRLRSVVPDYPKVLAPIGGRACVTYLLDQMAEAGIREVCLLTGYRAGQVEATLGLKYRGLNLRYSVETAPLGTAGALRAALNQFVSEHVLVMNGDSYCNVNLHEFAKVHQCQAAEVSLVLTFRSDTRQHGRAEVDESGRVVEFQEKGAVDGPGWVNAGIYLLGRGVIPDIPLDRPVSLEREMLPVWARANRVHGYRCSSSFLDIGTPESYAIACRTSDLSCAARGG